MDNESILEREQQAFENNRAWQTTLKGDFDVALQLFDAIIKKGAGLGEITNRGITRLLAGDTEGALDDFKQSRSFLPTNRSVEFVGVALWLTNNWQSACQDWAAEIERRRAGKIIYTDAAGGVQSAALLWWASSHTGFNIWKKMAESELRRRWRTRQAQNNWPGKVAPFLLGMISEEDFINGTTSTYASVEASQLSQANFYIGAKYLAVGDKKNIIHIWKKQLQKVIVF